MDLKFTKAMPLPCINKRSKSMDLVQSIEKRLVELKNSSGQKQIQGLKSEYLVAKFLHQKKYGIVNHRLKTPFSELDLLIENQKGELAIVEVKTLLHQEWMEERVSNWQKQRLIRASFWLQEKYQKTCIVLVAFVFNKQIKIYSLD